MLVTVFYKHKYIIYSVVTPEDAVMAASGNMAATLKGKMPQHLQESNMESLQLLQDIFTEFAQNNQNAPPERDAPVSDKSPPTEAPKQRRSGRLTSKLATAPKLAPEPPHRNIAIAQHKAFKTVPLLSELPASPMPVFSPPPSLYASQNCVFEPPTHETA